MNALEAVKAFRMIAEAFVDTVADVHPDPAPSGPMYAAYMAAGGGLQSFQQWMDLLVKADRLKYLGNHCYALSDSEIRRRGLK